MVTGSVSDAVSFDTLEFVSVQSLDDFMPHCEISSIEFVQGTTDLTGRVKMPVILNRVAMYRD